MKLELVNPMRRDLDYWLVVYRKKGGRKPRFMAFDTGKEAGKWSKTSGMVILMVLPGIVHVTLED